VPGEPLADDAGHHQRQDEVRRDRAKSDIERPEWRKERNNSVDDVRSLREDLGDDVDDEERQRAEREGAMHGLRHHPVPGPHHDPVGGDQAEQHGPGQADESEHPGVVQHEALRSSVNDVTDLGERQHQDDHHDGGAQRRHDLRRVLPSRSLRPRMHTLTMA
jgi:hypothetical protein